MIINVTNFAPLLRPAGVFLCGLLVSVCLVACMAESLGRVPAEDPIPVTLRVGTARAVPGANADGTVHNIYLLAFNRKEGGKRSYGVHLADLNAKPFTLPGILTGQYDFCIVANPSAALVGALDGVSSRKAMEALSAGRDELAPAADRYLMCAFQEDVLLATDGLGNGRVTYTDREGTLHTESALLGMTLARLAAKVNVTVTLRPGGGTLENVRLTSLPQTVPLLPLPNLQAVKGADIPLNLNTTASTPESFVYEEVVIPSYLFTPVVDKGQAALLQVTANGIAKRAALRHSPATMPGGDVDRREDYTLHRNVTYNVSGNASVSLPLEISVLDWNGQDTDITLGGYSFSNLGQPGCGDNLSANGETFTATFTHANPMQFKATKGRMRYNVEGGDQEVFYEFNIPDPGAEGVNISTLEITTPIQKKHINNVPIALEAQIEDGSWQIIRKGTLWPPNYEYTNIGYTQNGGVQIRTVFRWARRDIKRTVDSSNSHSFCNDYYEVHLNHPIYGKGQWSTASWGWNNNGVVIPLWEALMTDAPLGNLHIYGDVLVRGEKYRLGVPWSPGTHLGFPANLTIRPKFNLPDGHVGSDPAFISVGYGENLRTRCARLMEQTYP